jgi:hypothetical protein
LENKIDNINQEQTINKKSQTSFNKEVLNKKNSSNDNAKSLIEETNLNTMASMSISSSSSATTSSPVLENYLLDLKRVIEWLANSDTHLNNQSELGQDVNIVKQQFQTHEDFMLDLTKHQNNVGLVLQEGSRLINSGSINQEDDLEVRKQMKLLNDMWENLRLKAVDRQAKLHESLMKLQNEQLSQMDQWLSQAEARIQKISQLADSMDGLIEQKDELSRLQDDLVKEQEAVDCLKQIIVVVDDNTDDQAFTDLENKLSNLSDRWSNVCKFVGNRWFSVQDLILKLQSIETDFNDLTKWIDNKSIQLNILIEKTKPMVLKNNISVDTDKFDRIIEKEMIEFEQKSLNDEIRRLIDQYKSVEFANSLELIKILKDIELEMQAMHSKLNEMNEIGEQIGTQLNNSPNLTSLINNKMDLLESKWNSLLEKMEYLSKVCTEQQQLEIVLKQQQSAMKDQHGSSNTTIPAAEQQAMIVDDNESVSLATQSAAIAKQRRLNVDDLNNYKSIDSFVNELNQVFEKITRIIISDDLTPDEQQELIKARF